LAFPRWTLDLFVFAFVLLEVGEAQICAVLLPLPLGEGWGEGRS
jgi:hypothetical protein